LVSELGILVHNKASKPIRLGEGHNFPEEVYHREIKPDFLDDVGAKNYAKKVGTNPDLVVNKGEIELHGQGKFSGKTFKTGIKASEYFGE
jgi:hypothetical protein